MQRDLEAWCEDKAKWEEEIHRAREMEKEAYDRYEVSSSHSLQSSGTTNVLASGKHSCSTLHCVYGIQLAEQERKKIESAVIELEREVSELKATNVRMIGHANSRQKIQLHHKLKEELDSYTKKVKALEQENFTLNHQLKVCICFELSGSLALSMSLCSMLLPLLLLQVQAMKRPKDPRVNADSVLGNVTNILGVHDENS